MKWLTFSKILFCSDKNVLKNCQKNVHKKFFWENETFRTFLRKMFSIVLKDFLKIHLNNRIRYFKKSAKISKWKSTSKFESQKNQDYQYYGQNFSNILFSSDITKKSAITSYWKSTSIYIKLRGHINMPSQISTDQESF